ncbi:hypothetical protein UlMin_032215 [Ulmus minor]
MGSQTNQDLHFFFFPFQAQGHLIPIKDMALLFASRGAKSTIITTSAFVPSLSKTLEKSREKGTQFNILTVKTPAAEVGLPEGTESVHMVSSPELHHKFLKASGMVGPQLEELLEEHRPDCLVADMFFPWAIDIAGKFQIPTLTFHGTGCFSLCSSYCVSLYQPHKKVKSDSEPFTIPTLPDQIELTRDKIPDYMKTDEESEFTKIHKKIREEERKSFGVLINSFDELEPAYFDHYRGVLGIKSWHIGPLFLSNREIEQIGTEDAIDRHDCLKWLDSKKPNSVVYICFGSMASFCDAQLMEIALGIEASGQQFVWVVKKEKQEGVKEDWLPEGFEERMEGKGLIIRGWAPQVLILEHEAIGGFVTHCGWNSTLEAVTAGVPMVTWPVSAEQFYNEKLVTQVLGIGVEVGAKKWCRVVGDDVKKESVEKAARRVMEGEEAEKMRGKAKALAGMARSAIEKGGSSYSDVNALFEDLREYNQQIKLQKVVE